MRETSWADPARSPHPTLTADAVDVWRADLSVDGAQERALLSPAEEQRAARFARQELGRRWALARGILRALLARYTGLDPRALEFREGPHGKPALAGTQPSLRFNLSHSGGVALYVLSLIHI